MADSDDGTIEGTNIKKLGDLGLVAGDKFGKSLRTVDEMQEGMIRAGFVDVSVHCFKVPIGPWPKDKHMKTLGRYMRLVWEESMEMWTMMLWTKILGVSNGISSFFERLTEVF